jgi:UDP-N-acetylmuramate dehydrogenase
MNAIEFRFQSNHLLRPYTTFQIGGPARHFIEIQTIADMQEVIAYCHQNRLRYFILGKGSNILFDDQGFDGLVILNKIAFFEEPSPGLFHVGAGYSFSLLGTRTAREGWGGLEFASGIPGSIGGAVYMNAGANGNETAEALVSVEYVDEQGSLIHYPKEALQFSYRTSSFQTMRGAIVGATFALTAQTEAKQRQLEIIQYRKKTQPYQDPSAGCAFTNPHGACLSAGALIDKSGLKGFSVGGAAVSTLHANFIINQNSASAKDVLDLIALVQAKVKEQCEVDLEKEIRHIRYQE